MSRQARVKKHQVDPNCALCFTQIQAHEKQNSRPFKGSKSVRVHGGCKQKAYKQSKLNQTLTPTKPIYQPIQVVRTYGDLAGASYQLRDNLKPWEEIKETQKNTRKRKGNELLEVLRYNLEFDIGIPPDKVIKRDELHSAQAIGLDKSQRDVARKVADMPTDNTVRHFVENELSDSCCIAVEEFDKPTSSDNNCAGAYAKDPIGLVQQVVKDSKVVALGADCGAGLTKVGVTFSDGARQHFLCLAVYEGTDHWSDLAKLGDPGLMHFDGRSQTYVNIWSVLQSFLDEGVKLNGDWVFLNSVLGLMSSSSIFPCPICIVHKDSLLKPADLRSASTHSRHYCLHHTHYPLLKCDPANIVPTPLHIFLGIGTRVVQDVLSEIFGEVIVEQALAEIKTTHSKGCSGRSSYHSLNGPELVRFLEQSHRLFSGADIKQSCQLDDLVKWLNQLQHFLLTVTEWSEVDLQLWSSIVSTIQSSWTSTTGHAAFPKLHMLTHAVEFARRHRFLSLVSESSMERFHHQFNHLYNIVHLNSSHMPATRLKRCLSYSLAAAVKPHFLADMNLPDVFKRT